LHGGDKLFANLDAGYAWGKLAVGGQVVPGEGHLLRRGSGCERKS
jgi:hypothetical protein